MATVFVAGDKDVRIWGGADTIRQYLRAGVVEQLVIHLAPIPLGEGTAATRRTLAAGTETGARAATNSARVTHLRHRIAK
jgi:dihydrofolate reductase